MTRLALYVDKITLIGLVTFHSNWKVPVTRKLVLIYCRAAVLQFMLIDEIYPTILIKEDSWKSINVLLG